MDHAGEYATVQKRHGLCSLMLPRLRPGRPTTPRAQTRARAREARTGTAIYHAARKWIWNSAAFFIPTFQGPSFSPLPLSAPSLRSGLVTKRLGREAAITARKGGATTASDSHARYFPHAAFAGRSRFATR